MPTLSSSSSDSSSDDEDMRAVREAALKARRDRMNSSGVNLSSSSSGSDSSSGDDSDSDSFAPRRRQQQKKGGSDSSDSSDSDSDDGIPSPSKLRQLAEQRNKSASVVDDLERKEGAGLPPPPGPPGSGPPPPPGPPGSNNNNSPPPVVDDGPYSTTRVYSGVIMKAAKYTKKWVPRYVTITDRQVAYSMNETASIKQQFEFIRIVRGAERHNDELSLIVEGETGPKRDLVSLTLKAKDRPEFDLWYRRFANPLIHYKMMDPINWNIPKIHPRTHLELIDVPLKHLATFAPLDRLLLHYFNLVSITQIRSGTVTTAMKLEETVKQCIFIGDRMLYVCKMDANISRCVAMKDIVRVFAVGGKSNDSSASSSGTKGAPPSPPSGGGAPPPPPPSSAPPPPPPPGGAPPPPAAADAAKPASNATMTIGVQCSMPEFDILFSTSQDDGEHFINVLSVIHKCFSGHGQDLEVRRDLGRLELLKPQLSLVQSAYYSLKITLPMSKKFLSKSIDEWAKQKPGTRAKRTGSVFGGGPMAQATSGENVREAASVAGSPAAKMADGSADGSAAYSPLGKSMNDEEGSTNGPSNPFNKLATSPNNATGDAAPQSPLANLGKNPMMGGASSPTSVPPPGIRGSRGGGKIVIPNGIDKMQRLLLFVGLPQYYPILQDRFVDWDVFSCMDASDLNSKGITNLDHQIVIENALNDQAVMKALQQADDAAFNAPANPTAAKGNIVLKGLDALPPAPASLGTGGPNGGRIIDEDAL